MNGALHFSSVYGGETLALSAVKEERLHVLRPSQDTEVLQSAMASVQNADERLYDNPNLDLSYPAVMTGLACAGAAAFAASGYIFGKARSRPERPAKQEVPLTGAADKDCMDELTFSSEGRSLVVGGMFANAYITADDAVKAVEVTVSGKRGRLDRIDLNAEDGTVRLAPRLPQDYLELSAVGKYLLGRVFGKLIKKSGVELVDRSDLLTVVAKVPSGSTLGIGDIVGSVRATGKYGDARVRTAHTDNVYIESTAGLHVAADSGCRIHIGTVDGPVAVNASHDSLVTIDGGKTNHLRAKLGSRGTLRYMGIAEALDLDVDYYGKAKIRNAGGAILVRADSDCEVTIDGGTASAVDVTVSYGSNVIYGGVSQNAKISTGPDCYVELGGVSRYLRAVAGDDSAIKVKAGDIKKVSIDIDSDCKIDLAGDVCGGEIRTGNNSAVRAAGFDPDIILHMDKSSKLITKKRPGPSA